MPQTIIAIIISYLVGSIPTAYIFGRVLKGVDIRQHGSGNVGATNAMRILGKVPGAVVLFLDILKGFLAVMLLPHFFKTQSEIGIILIGLSCVFGHIWTVFLGFKGGKGIATTLGVLLALAAKVPGLSPILGLVLLVWLVFFLLFRVVSLASILSALALPIFTLTFSRSKVLIVLSIFLSLLVIWRHKSNISRLIQNKESRIV